MSAQVRDEMVASLRQRLANGERVVLESTAEGANEILSKLGSEMRVHEVVHGGENIEHPHVEAGVEVRSVLARFKVRSARRVSGGAPALFAGAFVVCAQEPVLDGTLVVGPLISAQESFDEFGRSRALEELYGVSVSRTLSPSALCVTGIPVVETGGWSADIPGNTVKLAGEEMRASVRTAVRELPACVVDAVLAFQEDPHPSGALLLRGCPIGELPPTPETPTAPTTKDRVSEHTLLSVARLLGQSVGYLPEHGGDLVQNILPTREGADRQVSTSSKTTLLYHTEAAFHPWRPRWLLLLCLRGDASARTTLVSARDVVHLLDDVTKRVLAAPRFVTGIDESYAGKRSSSTTEPHAVLAGWAGAATFRYDAELTQGLDEEARAALHVLNAAVGMCEGGVVLDAGDLLVVDNTIAIHGRSPFTPRFDGTDRWLQRAFVLADLHPAASELDGRIVATQFRP